MKRTWWRAAMPGSLVAVQAQLPSDTEYLTIPDLVERWQITPSKVHRLVQEHALAGVYINGVFCVPAEFTSDQGPLHSLRGTLLALHDAGFSNDEAVVWLLTDNDELGQRPVAALIAGRKSAVRRATQALAF